MAFELSLTVGGAGPSSPQPTGLVNTEIHEHLLLLLRRCGVICSTREGELVNIEGDPDHPVNQGGLCPKRATMFSCAT